MARGNDRPFVPSFLHAERNEPSRTRRGRGQGRDKTKKIRHSAPRMLSRPSSPPSTLAKQTNKQQSLLFSLFLARLSDMYRSLPSLSPFLRFCFCSHVLFCLVSHFCHLPQQLCFLCHPSFPFAGFHLFVRLLPPLFLFFPLCEETLFLIPASYLPPLLLPSFLFLFLPPLLLVPSPLLFAWSFSLVSIVL